MVTDAVTDFVVGLWVLAMLVGLYFAPTIVAWQRGVTNVGSIVVVNVFLGWTFIGWVVALAMALRSAPREEPAVTASTFRNCPNCNRSMSRELGVCPHCQAESAPWMFHDGLWWAQDHTGAWQWLDEAAKTWRWYEDGAPSNAPDAAANDHIDNPAADVWLAPSAELERLADLHARGILTDDEFQQAKQRVLNS